MYLNVMSGTGSRNAKMSVNEKVDLVPQSPGHQYTNFQPPQ